MCIRSGSFAKLLRRPFHDFLHCALCVTQGHRIESIRPTGSPVRGVTSTSNPALWPCTFCSDRPVSYVSTQLNSTQREFTDAGETLQCPHLFINIKYKTIRHILLFFLLLPILVKLRERSTRTDLSPIRRWILVYLFTHGVKFKDAVENYLLMFTYTIIN